MLGIASTELALAYILSIAAGVLCLVYGLIHYNDTGPSTEELRKDNKL